MDYSKLEGQPIDLNSLYCFWYGHDQYLEFGQKELKCVNFNEAHLEELWKNRWFAKFEQQKIMDQYLVKYESMIEQHKNTVPTNMFQRIALIILYDQITRNIYRGTPKAYQYDDIAKNLATSLLKEKGNKLYEEFPLHIIITLVLTLCHSENLDDQLLGLEIVKKIKEQYPNQHVRVIQNLSQIHQNHLDRIQLFGRIPDRNKYLGRQSTEQEKIYLQTVDSKNIFE